MGSLKNLCFHCKTTGMIRISINLLEMLNYPKYVRFLINIEKKEMAVQFSNKDDHQALKIRYQSSVANGAEIHSMLVARKIFEEMHWDKEYPYRTTEYKQISKNIVVVNLATAKQLVNYK